MSFGNSKSHGAALAEPLSLLRLVGTQRAECGGARHSPVTTGGARFERAPVNPLLLPVASRRRSDVPGLTHLAAPTPVLAPGRRDKGRTTPSAHGKSAIFPACVRQRLLVPTAGSTNAPCRSPAPNFAVSSVSRVPLLLSVPTFAPIQEVSHFVEATIVTGVSTMCPSPVDELKAGQKRPRTVQITHHPGCDVHPLPPAVPTCR
jgi:hypothetical protein